MEKTYECRTCKKLTVGFPTTYRSQCLECRVLEMRNIYDRERLGVLGKRELEMEHSRLQKKIRRIDVYEMCDDDKSQSEKSSSTHYVPETPVKKRAASLTRVTSKRERQRNAEARSKVKLVKEIMEVKRSLNKKVVRKKSQFSF